MRIIGILLAAAGIVMIGFSQYIKGQVAEGKQQISSGERKVSQGKTLFGANPVSKEVGDQLIFKGADRKIAEGKEQVAYYSQLASQLQTGGIIVILIGAGLFAYSFKKKR